METFRVLYLTFVILYLITLAIGLWFLLYYSGVPGWVWIFFAIAIILLIISTMMRETREQNKKNFDRWGIFFVVLDVISIILMIVGFIFVVMYSTLPWWIWLILGLSILFLLIVGILRAAKTPKGVPVGFADQYKYRYSWFDIGAIRSYWTVYRDYFNINLFQVTLVGVDDICSCACF